MAFTRGFAIRSYLADHHARHGAQLGAADVSQYQEMADTFLGGPRDASTTLECIRRNGDRLRYNQVTEEFGILTSLGVIRTYYKADPTVHGYPHNLAYFLAKCEQ